MIRSEACYRLTKAMATSGEDTLVIVAVDGSAHSDHALDCKF